MSKLIVSTEKDEKEIEKIRKRRGAFFDFIDLNQIPPDAAVAMMLSIAISIMKSAKITDKEFFTAMKESWNHIEVPE